MELTLEQNEADLLKDVLERHLGNLRMEITHTENYEMREDMKKDEETIKALIARLGGA